MKKYLFGIFVLSMTYACSPKTGEVLKKDAQETPINAHVDLVDVDNDRVWVEIDPGAFTKDSVIFRLPRVVQGTYDVSDFGSFTEGLVAYDYSGEEIETIQEGANTWIIPAAREFDKVGYYVNDTFDIESGDKPTPFSPSGTNIEEDNFVLNLHGFVGYFESLQNHEYSLEVIAPAGMKKSSALETVSSTLSEDEQSVTDVYHADRYFDITDNPMFYGALDVAEFKVEDIEIVLSVYSPNGTHTAASIQQTISKMMDAQKEYLGTLETANRYDIYLYLADQAEGEPSGYGALEHHTSTVVVLPEAMPTPQLAQTMVDVVSHEFFHIVTPLSVHSEDVHYFDYNAPTFSKHLWMYEGVTEYFASHFQVYEDLQPRKAFYSKIQGKIESSMNLDDEMSFTKMSENILDEPYASNYLNVYQKGALIGMCIDILMREESNGQRSMLSLMKELSTKYGIENPFEDDKLIEEITQMTYPSVGEFLQTHVQGNTPIDYRSFFDKVGLAMGEAEVKTTFFMDGQVPLLDGNPSTGTLFFRDVELNSSLKEIGVQPDDTIKVVNGTEYTIKNARELIIPSFQWAAEQEVSMTVIRNGEEVELTGTAGTPMIKKQQLIEAEDVTEAQIKLRNAWLGD
ncbi:MAG: peptidase M61 [Balneolaceae bacterium]|nr:peptidase M61 [Balneolaceae bacterium]